MSSTCSSKTNLIGAVALVASLVSILALAGVASAHPAQKSVVAIAGVSTSVKSGKRCKVTGRTRKARMRSAARCARTKTSKHQDSVRGPKFDPAAAADGRGADPAGTQGAIDWALAQQGRTDYYWWCLKFVAHAFNRPYAGFESPVAMVAARGVNGGEPPVGSLVMFGAVKGNPYGHVGIYLGGGKMINALQTVRISALSYTPNYRGWQYPPADWGGRAPSNPAPPFVASGYTPPSAAPSTPAPAQTGCAAAGGTSAGGAGVRGFTVSDIFYGGTWARTDTCDGSWHAKSAKPGNAAWWYPNGLGVGVDCARSSTSYTVKWADGHVETWNTWFHVTDGKWFPSAAANETASNGLYGLPTC